MDRKISNANCPKCGKVMEEGFIHSPKQIMWSLDGISRLFDLYDEYLVPMSFRRSIKVPALRCKECKIVIFEH